jgi:hypothetical protein
MGRQQWTVLLTQRRLVSYRDIKMFSIRKPTTREETKTKTILFPNLTGLYLSTEMELEKSEDILLTISSADVHERSLVAIARKFVD